MIIDKLMSPAIRLPLSGLTISTQTLVPPGDGQAGVIDLGVARNIGMMSKSNGPAWEINVRGATSAGAATMALQLITSASSGLGSPTTLFTTGVTTLANLVKFDQFFIVPDSDAVLRYIAWQAIVATAVFTGGTVSVEYVADMRRYRAYTAQGNR